VNKTADIEEAILIELHDGPKTLDALIAGLRAGYEQMAHIELTWVGVAMSHLGRDGRIDYPNCDHGYHEGDCLVEAIAR
jgi:hypothetical protein